MTSHRDILTAALVTFDDPELRTITPEFALQLMEIVQQLTIVKSKSIVSTVDVTFQPSIVPGMETVPVRSLRHEAEDYFVLRNVRVGGKSLDAGVLDMVLPFLNAWNETGVASEYYLVGNNLLCIRRIPAAPTQVSVSYVPYVSVDDLDETIVLRDEYREPLRMLVLAFLFIRLSRFELAKQQLEQWSEAIDNANTRTIRRRDVTD